MTRKHKGIAAAGIGGLLILIGVMTNAWAVARLPGGVSINIGLHSAEVCDEGTCVSASLSKLSKGELDTYLVAARITMVTGVLAALFLLLAAGMAAQDRHHLGPFAPSSPAFAFTALTLVAAFFAMLKLFSDSHGKVSLAWSFFLYGAGVMSAIVGCLMLSKAAVEDADDGWWE
jgi:hypothetical protein